VTPIFFGYDIQVRSKLRNLGAILGTPFLHCVLERIHSIFKRATHRNEPIALKRYDRKTGAHDCSYFI